MSAKSIHTTLPLLLSIAACVVHVPGTGPDDGFRAKVAAGCRTIAACTALNEEASTRYRKCMTDASSSGECSAQQQDKSDSGTLLYKAQNADAKAAASAAAERGNAARDQTRTWMKEEQQYASDAARPATTCEEIAALDAAAVSIQTPRVAEKYKTLVKQRRDLQVARIQRELARATSPHRDLAEAEDLAAVREEAKVARQRVDDMRCYDADAWTKAKSEVEAWATATEASVVAEEKCRATPQCLGDRVAVSLCAAIADRADAVREMARERANPSGLVNRTVLYDLGRRIQDDDDAIKALRARYVAIVKRPYNEGLCAKQPP